MKEESKVEERSSFIFYRSFYEALEGLKPKDREVIYTAICKYMLDDEEINTTGICKVVWTLIKPQLDANKKKYKYGSKGGRPKKETKEKPKETKQEEKEKPKVLKNSENVKPKVLKNEEISKPKHNLMNNEECRMNNEECRMNNEECRMNNEEWKNEECNETIGLFEQEFGRPLSPIEIQSILELEKKFSFDLLKLALTVSIKNNVRSLRYIEVVLINWKQQGIATIEEAQKQLESINSKKHSNNIHKSIVQEWNEDDENEEPKYDDEERKKLIEQIQQSS